jgi:RNA polymerase sigma factor (sigma-70 family)
MVDNATIQLEKYYQKILSQEGLGIYRANPWERNRPFNPEELERLVLPEKMQRLDIHLPLQVLTEREQEVIFCLFYDQISERETARKLNLSRSSVRTYRDRALRKLRRKIEKAEGEMGRGGEGEYWQKTPRGRGGEGARDS